jgi:hypothetical protein
LREQDSFENEIPEFLAKGEAVVAVEGLEHFIRFFEQKRPQRLERLRAVPRAAVGAAKVADDVDQTGKRVSGACRGGHERYATMPI